MMKQGASQPSQLVLMENRTRTRAGHQKPTMQGKKEKEKRDKGKRGTRRRKKKKKKRKEGKTKKKEGKKEEGKWSNS